MNLTYDATELENDFYFNESIKTLRTNIQFCGNNQITMITSALPNEGKSEIAFALSLSLSKIKKKVLLIDTDIRNSNLYTKIKTHISLNGLSEYLSGQKELKEIIYHINNTSLDIIFAGPLSPNPSELLESTNCENMFNELKDKYDYIIVDTAPSLYLSDSMILSKFCNGVILIIEQNKVNYNIEYKIKNKFEKTNCKILGAVLNKTNNKSKQYGYYGKI